MLRLKDISVVYQEKEGEFVALEHINLHVKKGSCLAILGKSGCGKSTLLNIIAGLKKPTEGEVFFQGKLLRNPSGDISMVFQNYGLFPWKTVRQNLLLPLKLKKKKVDEVSFMELVQKLDLMEQLDKYPSQLSGGQKQRVSIGRAILNETKLLLMDEPFSALDPHTRESIQVYLKTLLEENGITTVMVTHNIDEAIRWGDEIALFDVRGGRIFHILSNPKSSKVENRKRVKEYLMGA